MSASFELARVNPGIVLVAQDAGVALSDPGAVDFELGALKPYTQKNLTPFGQLFKQLVPILLEQEAALETSNGLLIPSVHVEQLYQKDFGLTKYLPEMCPFTLQIESVSSLGDPDFCYRTKFFQGHKLIHCKQAGAFIQYDGVTYFVGKRLFQLIDSISQFNKLPGAQKSKVAAFSALSEIKEISSECSVAFDKYLAGEKVIIADKVSIGLEQNQPESIDLYPTINQVDETDLKRSYYRFNEVQSCYDIPTPEGGRIRVILPQQVKEVVERMKSCRRVAGKSKDAFLKNPLSIFDGVENVDRLDLTTFGPRVKGIGPYVFEPRAYVRSSSGNFLSDDNLDTTANTSTIGFEAIDCDGEKIDFPIDSFERLEEMRSKLVYSTENGHLDW
jgi:hypothetical protein